MSSHAEHTEQMIATLRAALVERVQWVKDLADNLIAEETKTATLRAESERLREANEMMLTDIRRTDVDMLAFKAEIERQRAALEHIAKHPRGGLIDTPEKLERDEMIGIARAALAQEKSND
jgi:hypothetical protein